MNKVAQVTVAFWVLKICVTTLGETGADQFTKTMHLGYGGPMKVFLGILAVALIAQLSVKAFHATLFWTVVLMTSVTGTAISDYMDRTLELGYAKGSLILVSCLGATLLAWRLVQGSLSVSSIESRRAEAFYWTAVLFSNTLGTALGDWLADDEGPGLGFYWSAALIGGLLLVVLCLYRFTSISRVALFWVAFVLTRPFGATFGDVLARERDDGGVGFGTLWSSIVLAAILVVTVVWTGRRERALARA